MAKHLRHAPINAGRCRKQWAGIFEANDAIQAISNFPTVCDAPCWAERQALARDARRNREACKVV